MTPALMDPAAWAQARFGNAHLGDKRRTERLVRLAAQIAADPSASLPEATGAVGRYQGRLPDSSTPLRSASARSPSLTGRRRVRTTRTALIVDDTTEIDFGRARHIQGASAAAPAEASCSTRR